MSAVPYQELWDAQEALVRVMIALDREVLKRRHSQAAVHLRYANESCGNATTQIERAVNALYKADAEPITAVRTKTDFKTDFKTASAADGEIQ